MEKVQTVSGTRRSDSFTWFVYFRRLGGAGGMGEDGLRTSR